MTAVTFLGPCASITPDGTAVGCTHATGGDPFPPFAADSGPGIPSGFVALTVLMALVGIGITIWRVTAARDLARQAGMDPDQATAITLLGNEGLDATYVASTVRRTLVDAPRPTAGRSAEERLTELRALKDQGLVTEQEYQARRTAIVDSL